MSRMQSGLGAACLLGSLVLTACSTSEKVQARQIGDTAMSCDEIVAENERLDEALAEIDSNRGVTGTNLAAALFWLPGLAYTYFDADAAEKLVLERRSWMAELYDEKGCAEEPGNE